MNMSVTENDLHAYADGELAPESRAGVEQYLAQRPEEAERVRAYTAQNGWLRALYNPVLDEAVPERMTRVASRPVSHAWPRFALAAGLFFAGIGIGWVLRGTGIAPLPADAPFAKRAAVAHAVFSPEVRHPVEVGADQEDHLVKWLSKRLGTDLKSPKLDGYGYLLVGGRLLSGPQGPVAQFMYQDAKGQRLTMYVSSQRGETADTAFRYVQEGRVSVFYWIDRHYGYALSGEMGREALLSLANVVYKQLNP